MDIKEIKRKTDLVVKHSKKKSPPKRLSSINKRHAIFGATTTTTVTKITKLVLKPKKDVRESPSKKTVLTTNKYSSKPTTVQSAVLTGSSYQIKSLPNKTARRNETPTKSSKDASLERKLAARKFFKENHAKGVASSEDKLITDDNPNTIKSTALHVTEASQKPDFDAIITDNSKTSFVPMNEMQIFGDQSKPNDHHKTIISPVLKEITSTIINSIGTGNEPLARPVKLSEKLKRTSTPSRTPHSTQKLSSTATSQTKCKRKSYDPIKARQYIRQQQEKWKEEEKEKAKGALRKKEIRERLDVLRRNSLKIVGENVKRAKKGSSTSPRRQKIAQMKPSEDFAHDQNDQKPAVNPEITPIIQENSPEVQRFGNLGAKPNDSDEANRILLSSQKSQKSRIGILRRPDNFESPYSFPLQLTTNTIHLTAVNKDESMQSPKKKDFGLTKTPIVVESHAPSTSKIDEQEMALKVPESMSLTSSIIQRNKLVPAEMPTAADPKRPNMTAFWLRPTPVLPYPYNFIMAVRKKLESITNPVLSSNLSNKRPCGMKTDSDIHPLDTPRGRPAKGYATKLRTKLDQSMKDTQQSLKQQLEKTSPEKQYASDDYSAPSKSVNQATHSDQSKKQASLSEDYSTNFSSITLKTPESNEASRLHSSRNKTENRQPREFLSSTKISPDKHDKSFKDNKNDMDDSQDTLSISSGILSQSSPEKQRKPARVLHAARPRQISPLSTDHVDGLHIVSRTMQEKSNNLNTTNEQQQLHATSYINFSRGTNVYENENQEQFDVHKMLVEFNKGLSQVIKVNEKLHSVLSNPPSNRESNEKRQASETISTEYSDDFENDSHSKNDLPKKVMPSQPDNTISYTSAFTEYKSSLNDENSKNNYSFAQKVVEATESASLESAHRTDNEKNSEIQNTTEDDNKESSKNSLTKTNSTIRTVENYSVSDLQTEIKSVASNAVSDMTKSSSTIKEALSNSQISSATAHTEAIELHHSQKQSVSDEGQATSSTIKKSINRDASEKSSQSMKSLQKCIASERDVMNSSIGSDIFAVFNQTAMEFSNDINNSTTWSEGNISYSSLGMYEQLIQSEQTKTEHLTLLLKLREKTLIDRFKGQIAWLELQKQRMKEKGLTVEISTVKKKQRALLLRLEKERKEIHRLIKLQQTNATNPTSNMKYKISHLSANMSIRRTSASGNPLFAQQNQQDQLKQTKQALKAIELPGGANLEILLQKRENELRYRREHVERLLNWHQRLDVEEQEVLEMEHMIMVFSATEAYTTASSQEKFDEVLAIAAAEQQQDHQQVNTSASSLAVKGRHHSHRHKTPHPDQTLMDTRQQRHLQKIDKSLRTLQNISAKSMSSENEVTEESVQVVGGQLNKLWKRLTGQLEEKFNPKKTYKLSKLDLEKLYEEAKMIVLDKFHSDNEIKKLMNSTSNITDMESKDDTLETNHLKIVESAQPETTPEETASVREAPDKNDLQIPLLELRSSSETSPNHSGEQDQQEDNHNIDNRMDYYFTNSSSPNEEVPKSAEEEKSKATATSVAKDLTENEATIVEESVKSEYASTIADDVMSTNETYIKQAGEEQISIHEELSQSIADVESDGLNSDITEDSLNHPKLSQSEIPTVVTSKITSGNETEDKIDTISEEPINEQIETTSDKTQSAEMDKSNEINSTENNTQLIDDISFPHIDVTTFIGDNDHVDLTNRNEAPVTDSDEKYTSDDFERSKSSESSSNSSTDSSQKNKTDPEIITEMSSSTNLTKHQHPAEYNQNGQSSMSRSSSRSPTSSNEVKSKELEQRLIEIDDNLKDLNNTLSRSPVLEANSFADGSLDSERNKSIELENELSSTSHKDEQTSDSVNSEQHEEDENKENLSQKQYLVENNAPNSAANAVTPVKTDAVIRTKSINENFPLNEIYMKNDGDTATEAPSKYTNSNYMRDFPKTSVSIDYNKMPEAEALKRSQVVVEPEVKTLDQDLPYPFLREIPNKPPPPYPMHRNPLTTHVLPSDERIKVIVIEGIKGLYENEANPMDTTFVKSPELNALNSPAYTNETNIFERIILDVCREIMVELNQQQDYPQGIFKQPLSFYKPPNRLQCIQQYALKRIFKLLGRSNNLLLMSPTKMAGISLNTNVSIQGIRYLPSQMANMTFNNRRKRDLVDEILIQEMYEDEHKWTNFDVEEMEVKSNVKDLMTLLTDAEDSIEDSSTDKAEVWTKNSFSDI